MRMNPFSRTRLPTGSAALVLLLMSLTTSPHVVAADTNFIGYGTGSGTVLSCGERRLSGIQIRREDSGGRLVTQIRGRCTAFDETASWTSDPHVYTDWSQSDRPDFNHPQLSVRSASCPQDQWVGGIRGETGSYWFSTVMRRVRLACYDADAFGQRTGSRTTRSAGFSGGTSTGTNQLCPDSDLAQGLLVRRGYYVDGLALRCTAFFSPTAQAPTPVYPTALELSSTGSWAVTATLNPGAVVYELCFADDGSSNCWFQSSTLVPTNLKPGASMHMPLTIPVNKAGQIVRWRTRACSAGSSSCSAWSAWSRTAVVPPSPQLTSPQPAFTANSRTVTFSWTPVFGASGYQLFVFNRYAGSERYQIYNPTAVPNPEVMVNESVYGPGANSRILNLPASLGNELRWSVTACTDFQTIGRQCSLGYTGSSLYIDNAGSSFASLLNQSGQTPGDIAALSYQNPRCITCHGKNAFPSTKPDHFTNSRIPCSECHQDGWHAPEADLDFRNKSAAELCAMTLDHPDPIGHLKNDHLVLWSFTDKPADTEDIVTQNLDWNNRIDQWVAGGMQCP